ncbi:hypothetical protein [Natronorubrum sulfidifaciens]|uniref:Uncharacterized protein n=1 Tax=Natronorubrum sulfidifaciens JCM 14089 TaxID=1230460 RepID=L9WE77_9EURY|nr:hypothetical protein [Natronorubrum sulfidifaciens]ELY47556.1 hypothetical protein C495_04832 [Natronorubrum sulfidifaciens JCM 14089]
MNSRKRVVRHGLTGGGFGTLLLAASFLVLGTPTNAATVALVAWLVVVGGSMVAAGTRERVSVGSVTLEWPRVAAVAIALLAVGWATISAVGLLEGDGITGLGTLEIAITALVVGYFAWFARECWVGGALLGAETFAVD